MADIPEVKECPDKLYTWEEIRKHNTDKDCWIVMYGYVCNMTDFLPHHPGGLNPIMDMGGYDTTNTFEAIAAHTGKAGPQNAWRRRVIGRVDPNSTPPKVEVKQRSDKAIIPASPWESTLKVLIPLIIAFIAFQYFTASS